jgi:hypothetical protein
MAESTILELPALLTTAKRLLDDGVVPRQGKPLIAAWSRDPATNRLESHWVTDLTGIDALSNGTA